MVSIYRVNDSANSNCIADVVYFNIPKIIIAYTYGTEVSDSPNEFRQFFVGDILDKYQNPYFDEVVKFLQITFETAFVFKISN